MMCESLHLAQTAMPVERVLAADQGALSAVGRMSGSVHVMIASIGISVKKASRSFLTHLPLDLLYAAIPAHIVTVISVVHTLGSIRGDVVGLMCLSDSYGAHAESQRANHPL